MPDAQREGLVEGQRGFVMVIALLVTVVILTLAAAIIAGSMTSSDHATHESSRSAALAAADAGLQAAARRLGSQEEQKAAQLADCFTTKFEAKVGGSCPASATEELGNGQQYMYYVSPALSKTPNECTGLYVESSSKTVYQRCITAIGTANGITARAQERVADGKTWLYQANGIFSLSNLTFINKYQASGEVGTRGNLDFNNTVESTGSGITVKHGGTLTGENQCKAGCTFEPTLTSEQLAERYALPEPEAGPYEAAEKTNEDAKLKLSSGSINASHELLAPSTSTMTIPSGTYYFCYIFFGNTVTINYTPPVTIYLDSHNRSGSGCPSGETSGTINMVNTANWIDSAATPKAADLRIFAWGKPKETSESAPKLKFNNTVTGPWYAEIYAPYSFVEFVNKVQMAGAIEAGAIKFTNTVEFKGELTSEEMLTGGQSFYPTSYHVCTPASEYGKAGCS